jgi:TetR/AcrR family transcriptional regulator
MLASPNDIASDTPVLERKRGRRKDARPSEIVAAALDVFAEKGFAATKTDDIAARAGVSKGTLYLYFPSKEDLLKAVVQANVVSLIAEGREFVRTYSGSTGDMLRDFTLAWWRAEGATKQSAVPKLIMSEAGNFPDIVAYYFNEKIVPAEALITGILERGVASGEFKPIARMHDTIHSIVSAVIFLMHCKHSFAAHLGEDQMEPETFLTNHIHTLLHGLSNQPPSSRAS